MKGKMVYITISLFLGLIIAPTVHASGYEKLSTPIVLRNYAGDILYVGGNGPQNYSTIQNAVNSAHPGDTIFVYSYSSPYRENIIIETNEIQLIGENKYSTIVDGNGISDVIQIKSDYVTVSGFTIQHSGLIEHTEYHAGVHMIYPSDYNNITNNIIINNNNGICIQASNNNTVSKNIVSHNLKGILFLAASRYNIISENNFENNNISFFFGASVYNSIIENNIKNSSEYGLVLYFSRYQTIRRNNFINNTCHAYFIERFRLANEKNKWFRNYWDNWIGIGPKILKGEMFTEWVGQKLIPWINFDWIPAYKPFIIQV
jgi:parallel beta-helix repeat protein